MTSCIIVRGSQVIPPLLCCSTANVSIPSIVSRSTNSNTNNRENKWSHKRISTHPDIENTIYSIPPHRPAPLHSHHQAHSKLTSWIQVCPSRYLHYNRQAEFSSTLYRMPGLQDFIKEHLGHPWVFVDFDATVSLVQRFAGTAFWPGFRKQWISLWKESPQAQQTRRWRSHHWVMPLDLLLIYLHTQERTHSGWCRWINRRLAKIQWPERRLWQTW